MGWDINERGGITLTPLVSYSLAILYETGCGLRLVLSYPSDAPGTGSLVVQTAMTVEQAQALALDLQRTAERILSAPVPERPN
jgi:hypothetical protein